jgi:hypothetical protein
MGEDMGEAGRKPFPIHFVTGIKAQTYTTGRGSAPVGGIILHSNRLLLWLYSGGETFLKIAWLALAEVLPLHPLRKQS